MQLRASESPASGGANALAGFPFSPGFVAELVRKKDWSGTSLGPLEGWPSSLRSALELCLGSDLAMSVCWGPELLLFPNDVNMRLLGADPEKILGAPLFSVFTENRAEFEPRFERVRKLGETVRLRRQKAVRVTGGEPVTMTVEISCSPLRDETGAVAGVLVLSRESTEQVSYERRMEAEVAGRTRELSRSQAFLDSLIENLPNMVFVKDARDLRFVRFNRAGESLLGLSRSELLGKSDFDFFPREQAEHFVAYDRSVLAGRSIVDIPEEPVQTRHGLRYLHTRKIPLFGPDGAPEYLLGISDDITEKRKAEAERLRLSREEAALLERESANRRVRLLADASEALGVSLDYHATLRNLALLIVPSLADWCLLTAVEPDGAFRRVAAEHRDPALKPLLEELLASFPGNGEGGQGTAHVVQTGKPLLLPTVPDEQLERAAQSPRHIELLRRLGTRSCIVVPIRGREKVLGAIALMADGSGRTYNEDDLRTAEELGRRAGTAIDNALLYREAQQAISARDAFLSIASHELKTPLTSLMIQTQLRRRQLDRGNLSFFSPEKLLRMVETDARQLDRLTRLIDDMLDISRINSGRLTVQPEPVNLLQLVREVAERHQEQYAKAGCELAVEGDDHVLGMWDRFRIEQVVTNLLTNALKYGAGQPVSVKVFEHDRQALLEVRDRGIGIAPKDQERIFRQFERAVGPNAVSGLGLGLYIVRQILELHKGSIQLSSVPGEGSVFTVKLPALAGS